MRDVAPGGIDAILVASGNMETVAGLVDLLRPGARAASSVGAVNPEALAARGLGGMQVNAAFDRLGDLAELVARSDIRIPAATTRISAWRATRMW